MIYQGGNFCYLKLFIQIFRTVFYSTDIRKPVLLDSYHLFLPFIPRQFFHSMAERVYQDTVE